jgi:hypothetical protein
MQNDKAAVGQHTSFDILVHAIILTHKILNDAASTLKLIKRRIMR